MMKVPSSLQMNFFTIYHYQGCALEQDKPQVACQNHPGQRGNDFRGNCKCTDNDK